MSRRGYRKESAARVAHWRIQTRKRLLIFSGALLLTLVGVLMIQPAAATHTLISNTTEASSIHPTSVHLVEGRDSPDFIAASTSESALSHGQQQYEDGQLANALRTWQQAVDNETQPLRQAVALSYISLVSQDLGEWTRAEEAIARSIALLADSPVSAESEKVRAQILNVQGRLKLKRGEPETAWEIWQDAERTYENVDDSLGIVGARINQAQALQTMGLYRRASVVLSDLMTLLESQPDSEMKAIALQSLGSTLQTTGNLEKSAEYLSRSIQIHQQLGEQSQAASALLALANTQRLMAETDAAIDTYLLIEALPRQQQLSTLAKLNRLSLLLETAQWRAAQDLLPEVSADVQALPPSRKSVSSKVNLVESLLTHSSDDHKPIQWMSTREAVTLLTEAHRQAQSLQDVRAQSLALGELGKVYSYAQQWSDALTLEENALQLSQSIGAKDLTYRWQQQLGKVHYQQGDEKSAIANYSNAVATLSEVRRDLLATNVDVQYSFRKTVEPVYRELVSLLLLPEEASQSSLLKAREVVEELQVAELEDYFKSACIDSVSEYVDKLDSEAAVLYPIVLADRVEVIFSLPGQALDHHRIWQTEEDTNQTIKELFQSFNPALSSRKRLKLSEEIYGWLVRPVESALETNKIKTLVFVLDGKFRNIPMAALYDGDQYLLEKYSIALTPGLKLLGPHFQNPKPLQALMMGLTEARSGFSALPGVKAEIEQISARVNSEILFDREFTKRNLELEVDRVPFPILHLATHGQFSSDLENTFLLTWDDKLTLGDLDDLLRSRRQQSEPIELMVLSACQTAEGDDRAALGLAGMAIRSGARSTLATLWAVNDESTAALMTEFYQELSNTDLSKAEALRLAQIKILRTPEFSHPFYWSPFVLIGNWLS